MSLTANLSGKEYEQLISICFKFADLFSLTKNGWITPKEEKESTDLMQRLLPYHIETRYTNRWFCYRVPDEQKIETYLFRATLESQKSCYHHIIACLMMGLFGEFRRIYVFLKKENWFLEVYRMKIYVSV